jgi:hypothetical protein
MRERKLACDYVYLLSGSCMPARPICELKSFLDHRHDQEFIETKPEGWIVGGLKQERYQYHHFFNERDQRRRFSWNWKIQRAFGVKRRFPQGIQPRFGSQWWCLTKSTCLNVLTYIDKHPSNYQFFKTTWIPDELFFQTMVSKFVEPSRIFNGSLTYFKFSRKGKPIVLYDDHLDAIADLPYFFVRKVSPGATRLRRRLAEVAVRPEPGPLPEVGKGKGLFNYERRLAEQTDFPRPGQLFYGWQKFEGWPASAGALRRPFAVLYGPASITRVAREALVDLPGLTPLGHLFHPAKVDFGREIQEFKGLKSEDARIRDYDPPLFFTRVIERCNGFPIFELAPGENWAFEVALPHLSGAVTIPCLPPQSGTGDWMRLFWALAAISLSEGLAASSEPAAHCEDDCFPYVRARIDRRIGQFLNWDHQHFADRHFVTERKETNIPLFWGPPGASKPAKPDYHPPNHPEILRDAIGTAAEPLIRQFPTMRLALSRLSLDRIIEPLPERWRSFFRSSLAGGPNLEAGSWPSAACNACQSEN